MATYINHRLNSGTRQMPRNNLYSLANATTSGTQQLTSIRKQPANWNGIIWNWIVTELLNKISTIFKEMIGNVFAWFSPEDGMNHEIAAGNPTNPFQGPLAHAIGGGWPFSASIQKEFWLTPLMFTITLVNIWFMKQCLQKCNETRARKIIVSMIMYDS